MVKITIYLQNGKTVSAYLKRRQYDFLIGQIKGLTWWLRIKRWGRKQLNRIKYKEVGKNNWVRRFGRGKSNG